jgi:hypothetical protein
MSNAWDPSGNAWIPSLGGAGGVASLNGLTGALNLSTPNSTLNIGTSGSNITLDLNLANANTWTALQTFLLPASGPALLISSVAQSPKVLNESGGQGIQLLAPPATSTAQSQGAPHIDLFGQYWNGTTSVNRGPSIGSGANTNINLESLGIDWWDGTTKTDALRIDNPNASGAAIWPVGNGNMYDLGKGNQQFRNAYLAGTVNTNFVSTNGIGTGSDAPQSGRIILTRSGASSGYNEIVSPADGTIARSILFLTQTTTTAGIGNSKGRMRIDGGGAQGSSSIDFFETIRWVFNATGYAYSGDAAITADGLGGNLYLNAPSGKSIFLQNAAATKASLGATFALLSGFQYNVTTVTASTTLTTANQVVLVNASAGAATITLPAASSGKGLLIIVAKIDSSTNAVTVSRAGTDTIQGAASQTLSTQYSKSILMSDGTSIWYDLGAGLV